MKDQVDYPKFRRMLQSVENGDIAIRLRMSGEDWMNYARLLLLSESAMILEHGGSRVIRNLCNTIEFEIDQAFMDLAPFTVYEIVH